MQKKSIKLNRMAEKNLLDIFSCPLTSGFMIESDLTNEFFKGAKEFFVLGYSADLQKELEMLRMITQTTQQIEFDIEGGHFYECESLRSRHMISTNIVMSLAILFFKDMIKKGAAKRLKQQVVEFESIRTTMLNHAVKTGQIDNQDYNQYKNENLKSIQDARERVEKERINK